MKTENKITLCVILLFSSVIVGFFFRSTPLVLITNGCAFFLSMFGTVVLTKNMAK
jgi:uncharacterized membrane protein YiaA